MNWLDRQIINWFPNYGVRRILARNGLERLERLKNKTGERSFEVVSGNRLNSDYIKNRMSADSSMQGADQLRYQVRQLEQNNGFISGPIARVVNNVVGTGFRFQSRLKPDGNDYSFPKITEEDASRYNYQVEKNIKLWSLKADKRMIHNFDFLLRQAEGALLRDGGIILVGRKSTRKDRIIPYCLDIYEIDRLQTPIKETNNPKIRHGIEYDDEGVAKTCYILKRHPGDMHIGNRKFQEFEEVPVFNPNGTRKVFHLFNAIRPEQTVGYSQFAAALKDYQDMDRYREAEVVAALEAACLTGFVSSTEPDIFQQNRTVANMGGSPDAAGNTRKIHEFSPGEWHYLEPGEKADIFNPSRPTQIFGEFTNQLLEGPSNALDMPPEVLTQNWKGMNYSNARTVLLQFYLTCFIRRKYLIEYLCMPVVENVIRELIATGLVQARGFVRRAADYLTAHAWITPGWAWVDPVKEAQGKQIELKNNMETLGNICASKGEDWEEKLEQRARELKRMKDLEEQYDIKFPDSNKIGASNAGDADDGGDEKEEEEEKNLKLVKK